MRGKNALERKIGRQLGRIGAQADGALLKLACEYLTRRTQIAIESADRVPANHPLCEAEGGQKDGEDQCREGDEIAVRRLRPVRRIMGPPGCRARRGACAQGTGSG